MKMGFQGIGFLLQCYLMLAAAMYFDLGEQEEKCIIEEVPEDMLVTGESWRWKSLSSTHSPHFGVTVSVRDPNQEVVMSKRYGKFGKFTFTAHASGQHFLCFQTNSTRFAVFAGERLEKEEVFRQISEDTNSKVLWWAVVQTLTLLSVGFWQMKRLKDFFIAKKLV
uniref:Transmembrane emp24 domain-containing protein 11-like n=1 Tax=Echeneis naucrates TaxID=173247 RepID=A0A665VZ75_ECHNA